MSMPSHKAAPAAKGRRALTAKGLRTKGALTEAARQVFERDGYFGASVSEIGRRCGVSQGTFYQYFRNKDQVFREIVDATISAFWARADGLALADRDWPRALREVVGLLLDHFARNAALHRVLNEFELIEGVTISYYDSMARFYRDFFRAAADAGRIKPLDPNLVAYSLLGVAMFQQGYWTGQERPRSLGELTELTADLLRHGISGPAPWTAPADLAASSLAGGGLGELHWEGSPSQGSRTKTTIFQAAEKVFGELGYSRAGISEITRQAGVAQGTFYVHFKSKEDLMNGVVRFLSRELRRELRRFISQVSDRRDQEREGMLAFFDFLRRHCQIYRIVSESEAIVPESARYYYSKLADGYRRSLLPGMRAGQIREVPVEFMARYLMGLNHMVGLRWLVWSSASRPEIPRQVLADAVELAILGLAPA